MKLAINPDDFEFMGHNFYICDTGITADTYRELLDKIQWCHSVGIYMGKIPLQGHTIHSALPSSAIFN